jgi:hypothetical protein
MANPKVKVKISGNKPAAVDGRKFWVFFFF